MWPPSSECYARMSSSSRRVVVTQRFFDQDAIAFLERNRCEVCVADMAANKNDGDFSEEELRDLLAGASGWIVGHARVTRSLMTALPGLQVISRRGVGYERVDIEAAKALGRVVAIAAGGNDASVADHALGMMLTLARRFRESQALLENGKWSILMGSDLFEKTVGIIGLGRIGKSLVKRLCGFDCRVLVHTPRKDAAYASSTGIEYVDLPVLLEQSDFVSIHAPLTPATKFLIDEKALRSMKNSAVLINTARGGLVQDAHLLTALVEKRLAGAGLDVFLSESDPAFSDVTRQLVELADVVATPHAGASSREGLNRTNMIASQSVVAVFDGLTPPAACVVADGRVP